LVAPHDEEHAVFSEENRENTQMNEAPNENVPSECRTVIKLLVVRATKTIARSFYLANDVS
jgi:hypothetical protein